MLTNWINNIFEHPKTTVVGILGAVLVIAPVLSQQGINLGRAGTGTVLQLIGGLAVALMGMISKDPSSGN